MPMAPPGPATSRQTKATPIKPSKSNTSKPTATKSIPRPPTNLDDTVRLHITPLNPTLFPTLLPQSLFSDTTNYPPPVSYHTLEALPDKSYGYVDLPPQLAQKLTTRLNGAVFRGVKLSVQKARPRAWIPPRETGIELNNTHQSTAEDRAGRLPEENKRRKEDGVHPGIELPDGRWVKRAWTKVPITSAMGKPKEKKGEKATRKKDMKKGPLLFQTTLPVTVPTPAVTDPKALKKLEKKRNRAIAAAEAAAAEPSSTDNEDPESEEGRKIKRKKSSRVKLHRDKITIKEFTNTTKFPGFLKTSHLDQNNKRGKVTRFVAGVGWVDGEGQVVDDSVVRKAVEKQKYALGTESGVEGDFEKATNGSRQEMKEDVQEKTSNGDDEEMPDTYADSESSASKSESKSELDPTEAAEKVLSNGGVIGMSPEPVGNHDAGSTNSEESGSKSQSKFDSEQSGVDEDAENRHELVQDTTHKKPTPRIASRSHESQGFDASSTPSSPEAESNSCGSESGDEGESESEDGEEEEKQREEIKPAKIQVALRAPTLKLSIPTESASEANKPHPLEALFKPTTNVSTTVDAEPASGGLFNFSFADEGDDDGPAEAVETSHHRPYRSAAPTPDTAVVSKTIKWPDLARISPFEPTSPIAPRKLSFQQAPAAVSGDLDAPLLFQGNAESAYLRGLSIWSGGHLPQAKSITELPPDEEEEDADPKAPKKRKRKGNANEVLIGKHKERKVGQGSAVAKRAETRKEIWKERFFKYRGEWNREWKNKKREAGKLARRKQRERGIGDEEAK